MPEKHIMLLEKIVNHCASMEKYIKKCNYGDALNDTRYFQMLAIEHLDKEGYEMHGDIVQKKKAASK